MTNLFQPPLSRTITLLMASALWLVVGCGSGGGETTTVAGEVTIGGKPLPEDAKGTVSFAPVNDIEAEPVVAQIANSRYEASNVPVGAVRATFNIYREGPPKVSPRTGQEYREETSLVPPQHAAGHEVNIDAANENLDFNL